MGIGNWFKRFKRNAAALEGTGERMMGDDTQSQAARAERERQPSAGEGSASERRPDGDDVETDSAEH